MQKRALCVRRALVFILGAYLLSPSWGGPDRGAVTMRGDVKGNAVVPHRGAHQVGQPEVRETDW